jgi:hypothetical protein
MKPENADQQRRRDFPNDRMLPSSLLSLKKIPRNSSLALSSGQKTSCGAGVRQSDAF